MSVIAGLIGSGAGIVVIALAVLIGRHYRNLPGVVHQWIERLMIVLMYAGGSALAVTELGGWADDAIRWAAGLLGGLDTGLAHTALVITALFLLVALVVAFIWAPSQGTGLMAAAMPLILGLVAAGFLHQVYVATTIPAQALASTLSAWIGG